MHMMHLREGPIGDEYTPIRFAERQFIFPLLCRSSVSPRALRASQPRQRRYGRPCGL